MEIWIATEGEPPQTRHRTVYLPRGGLAVQADSDDPTERTGWGVVHLASGMLVCPCRLATRAQAKAVQQQLLALAVDWTQRYSKPWARTMRPLAAPIVRAAVPAEEEG